MAEVEHPLRTLLSDAARGRPPEADGSIDVLPAPEGARAALLTFTAHLVISADIGVDQITEWVTPGDFVSWNAPEFVTWLAERVGGRPGSHDVVLVAPGERRAPSIELRPQSPPPDHARVRRASRSRADVSAWTESRERAVLVIGRGLAGRYELALEVGPDWRGRGLGRAIAATARGLVPESEPLFAQVSPANAAALRALLAAGFTPIGAETLFAAG
jgi:GNAT superfamily N-acetyltransferase